MMSVKGKILKRIGLFITPVLVFVVVLFVMPLDKRFSYAFLQDNCMNKGSWLQERIFMNKEPIDIAFIGTSHTIDAIDDDIFQASLQKQGIDATPLNMGYCRMGRNMDYALIKDLFKHKQPQYIILEIREKENRDGHMDFGYVADSRDVLAPVLFFNDNIVTDIYNAVVVRMEALKNKIVARNTIHLSTIAPYKKLPDSTVADRAYLEDRKEHNRSWKYTTGFARWFYNQYSFSYIDKIIGLAATNNCKVMFLYLPEYGSIPAPEEMKFYTARGKVLIPPADVYGNPAFWKDREHMNCMGAQTLSHWLATAFREVNTQ
jgi:hypothetical protein